MLKLIRFLTDLHVALKYSKGNYEASAYQDWKAENIIRIAELRPRLLRNLIAKGLKENRKFEPSDEWDKAKAFYNSYWRINPTVFRSIDEVQIGSWVTVIGREWPERGNRYCEYHINWSGGANGTFKVAGVHRDCVDLYGCSYIDPEFMRLRPATDEEIAQAIHEFKVERRDKIMNQNKWAISRIEEIRKEYSWLD